ncbi:MULTISPECIES: hypothetical protein [unclassified Microcoleus]|uniref:hypothetical protein n=1 Tax=unclassified Microcoleus TaxID=2642155 RepID=UPI002FD69346
MIVRQPRYSKEEFAKAGDEIYESQVRIETAAFKIDSSEIAACDRLEVHHPDAQIWIVRIGFRYVCRSGVLTYKISSQSLLKVLQAAQNKNHP